jgi:hypothetical protein
MVSLTEESLYCCLYLQDLAREFRAELFGKYKKMVYFSDLIHSWISDPNEWADFFAASGAK